MNRMPPPARPNYGVDAPGVVMTFVGLAFASVFAGIFIGSASGTSKGALFWVAAFLFAGTATFMIYSSKKGKPALWALTLDRLELAGDEVALDVGCGRGLVMIEVARRLPDGHVTGIDIWRGKDQSGNAHVITDLNVEIAGVGDRVEVIDADMTDMPFEDGSFDLITASLAIHNLPLAEERQAALAEIVRVLRPGGRVVIIDIGRTNEFEDALRDAGLEDVNRSAPTMAIYPPARTVTATRPRRAKKTSGGSRSSKRSRSSTTANAKRGKRGS
jgi:SAM-dependent methyltransferase